ncbi:hypothetical protein N9937_00765, partial [bacterium]|nr:hypothetical protein [bacterium]
MTIVEQREKLLKVRREMGLTAKRKKRAVVKGQEKGRKRAGKSQNYSQSRFNSIKSHCMRGHKRGGPDWKTAPSGRKYCHTCEKIRSKEKWAKVK